MDKGVGQYKEQGLDSLASPWEAITCFVFPA